MGLSNRQNEIETLAFASSDTIQRRIPIGGVYLRGLHGHVDGTYDSASGATAETIATAGFSNLISSLRVERDGAQMIGMNGWASRNLQYYIGYQTPPSSHVHEAQLSGAQDSNTAIPYSFYFYLPFDQMRGRKPFDTRLDTRGGKVKELMVTCITDFSENRIFSGGDRTNVINSMNLRLRPDYADPVPGFAYKRGWAGEWIVIRENITTTNSSLSGRLELPPGQFSEMHIQVANNVGASIGGSNALVTRIGIEGDVPGRGKYTYIRQDFDELREEIPSRLAIVSALPSGYLPLVSSPEGLITEPFDFRKSNDAAILYDNGSPTGQAYIEVLLRRVTHGVERGKTNKPVLNAR